MTEIKWQEPPAATSGKAARRKYDAIVEQLKQRPGQWAVVAENVSPTISAYLKSRYGLETTTREVKNNRAKAIYARWPVGE